LYKCHALGNGTGGSDRLTANKNGDTPTGLWKSWYTKTHIGEAAYGNHGLIHISGLTGEALKATQKGRAGIAIHGGHTQRGRNRNIIDDAKRLMVTHGCVRVYNADIKNLVEKYVALSKTKTINVYVEEAENINTVLDNYKMSIDPKTL
jgi:lipoprotein-anchoring transpeptidase ErfK/SrfK